MKENKENLFADYLENNSIPENENLKEFESLKVLYQKIEKPTEKDPDASMDLGFYMMIEKEKSLKMEENKGSLMKVSWIRPTILKYAAGVVLLMGIFWLGRRTADKGINDIKELADLKRDVQETKELVMLSMLKKDSPSERIQAVNYTFEFQEPDPKVIDALVKTLNNDENINVRTSAAEALSHFGTDKKVRESLVQSLLTQKEPTLQITIIDILANLGEKRAISPMKQLIKNTETDDFVKRKAQESVKILTM